MFSTKTRRAIAQVLTTVSSGGAETFLNKHIGVKGAPSFVPIVAGATDEAVKEMATELVANSKIMWAPRQSSTCLKVASTM